MILTCRHAQHLMDAFIDGELSESQTAEMHAHLLQCPECQRELSVVRACGDIIGLDPLRPRLSAGFADRVLGKVQSARSKPVVYAPSARRNLRRWLEFGVAPAMAAAIVVAILFVPRHKPVSPVDKAIVQNPSPERTYVAGKTAGFPDALADKIDGAMESLGEARNVARQVDTFWRNALANASQQLPPPADENIQKSTNFVDELFRPFMSMFDPPITLPAVDEDIERF